MGLFRKRSLKGQPPGTIEGGVNPVTGEDQVLVPQGEVEKMARHAAVKVLERMDDMQEGRLALSDDAIYHMGAAVMFVFGDDLGSLPEQTKLIANTVIRIGYMARLVEVGLAPSSREGYE